MNINNPVTSAAASVTRGSSMNDILNPTGRYEISCVRNGDVVWTDEVKNLVTTEGKNHLLNVYFSGSSYTASWFLGLIGSVGYTTGPAHQDTMETHAGWAESTAYSNASRRLPVFLGANGGSISTSSAVSFSINSSAVIKGCFLSTSSVKNGTAGVLYSVGLFSNGDKSVSDGDSLNINYISSM